MSPPPLPPPPTTTRRHRRASAAATDAVASLRASAPLTPSLLPRRPRRPPLPQFFDAASGACLRSFTHAERQINSLAISPDRSYVVAGGHPLIRLYDVAGKSADPLVAYEGHTSNVTAVGWQRDGRWLFSGSEDGSVRIWDPRASGSQRDYDARAAVHSVCLHPNQAELISADHSGTLRVWDLAAGKCAAELCPEVDSPLSSVGIAADASIVVAANFNGSVFCWRPRAGDEHEFVPLKRLNVSFGAEHRGERRERESARVRGGFLCAALSPWVSDEDRNKINAIHCRARKGVQIDSVTSDEKGAPCLHAALSAAPRCAAPRIGGER